MSYSEWLTEYRKLRDETEGLPLIDVQEALAVGGNHAIVALGKKPGVFVDDHEVDPKYMRPWYASNKEEFAYLLETLKEKAAEQKRFGENLAAALTEEHVPELVMLRMTGEQVSAEPFDMLREGTRRKLKELQEAVSSLENPFLSFSIQFEVAGKTLTLSRRGEQGSLTWGNCSAGPGVQDEGELEDCMYFLSNFKLIVKKVEEFAAKLKNIRL